MPVQGDFDLTEMAQACVDDMGDIFWDYEPDRDSALGFFEPQEVAVASVTATLRELQREADRRSLCPPVLRSEYETLVAEAGADVTDATVTAALIRDADWTPRGADEVLRLAREYGTSILRNALALADALGIEDGSRGL